MTGTGSSKRLLKAYFLACLKPSSFILHITVYCQTKVREEVVDVLTKLCSLYFIGIKDYWQYGEFLILAKL